MKFETRRKMMQALIDAITKSKFTESELREFENELAHNSAFLSDFSVLLRSVIDNATYQKASGKPISYSNNLDPRSPWHQIAYEKIKKKRLSKNKVLEIMRFVAPYHRSKSIRNMPMYDLLDDFFNTTSQSAADEFLNALGVKNQNDEYLKGIIKDR